MLNKVSEIDNWLHSNQDADVSEYESRQQELERLYNPIMQKAYGGAQGGQGGSCGQQYQQGNTAGPSADEVD